MEPPPRSATDEMYRRVTGFVAAVVTLGGLVIVIRSLTLGAGLLSTGLVVGILFILVGGVRLFLAVRGLG
ncbi:MAG: hypothetical protein ACR2NA_04330 [Solirubrobacterales bacterium]